MWIGLNWLTVAAFCIMSSEDMTGPANGAEGRFPVELSKCSFQKKNGALDGGE
jgi:hypothetical protein